MGLGTKNSLADSDADTSIVKNDGIGNAETTAHKFRKLWHWQGPRVERHAAFSWKPHVTLIFRGSISDQSSNLPSEKLEQHWPGSLRNANHIYEIPGTLVPGLVEQNYKRHRQRQDFTVRLSQVTSVTVTASFIFPKQNYKRHCQQQDFSVRLSQVTSVTGTSSFCVISRIARFWVLSSRVTDPLFSSPAVCLSQMAAINLHGFLDQSCVRISFDPSSRVSKVSPTKVYTLNLAAIFTGSGHLTCTAALIIPTLGSYYSSHLDLIIGYDC
jgi:hypothetical protein